MKILEEIWIFTFSVFITEEMLSDVDNYAYHQIEQVIERFREITKASDKNTYLKSLI